MWRFCVPLSELSRPNMHNQTYGFSSYIIVILKPYVSNFQPRLNIFCNKCKNLSATKIQNLITCFLENQILYKTMPLRKKIRFQQSKYAFEMLRTRFPR